MEVSPGNGNTLDPLGAHSTDHVTQLKCGCTISLELNLWYQITNEFNVHFLNLRVQNTRDYKNEQIKGRIFISIKATIKQQHGQFQHI